MHRPRTIPAKVAVLLGLYLFACLVAAVMPFTHVRGAAAPLIVVVVLVAAFVTGQQFVWYPFWFQLAGAVAAVLCVCVCFAGSAVQGQVLAGRGTRVEAYVADVHHGYRSYDYGLVDARYRPIAGRLAELKSGYRLGDAVTVVVDPAGRVDPMTDGEVADARMFGKLTLAGLALTVLVIVLGGWRPGTGKPPRNGPGGLWIFET